MARVTLRSFAKINLSLRVKGVRADGFHDVQTILQSVDLSDRVTCEATRGPFRIICSAADVPTDTSNLVWKAAQRLWEAAGRNGQPTDAAVMLDKQIPTRAGLGGGSSNAAAALLGLRRLWKLKVPDEALHGIAARLGSDVPYFLVGGTALGLGRGEEVYALEDLPRWWVVLVFPPFGIETAEAYRWLDEDRERGLQGAGGKGQGPGGKGQGAGGKGQGARGKGQGARHPRPRVTLTPFPSSLAPAPLPLAPFLRVPLLNDLERPVIERHPLIGTLRDRLIALGATMAAMSGSGSTVFGIFTTARAAESASRKLQQSGAKARIGRMRPR